MATFDIFIKGINPERVHESEQIKIQVADALHISLADVDELFSLPNGACIRRNASEQEAINYQRALTNLGLVCLYNPAKKLTNSDPDLVVEEQSTTASVTCPNCDHEMVVEDTEPEKCIQCGIDIAKFLAQKHQQENRQANEAELLASQNQQKAQAMQKQLEEADLQRKTDESEKDDLQQQIDIKKTSSMKLLTIGGLIAATAIGGYFFSSPNNPPPMAMRMETPTEDVSKNTPPVETPAPKATQTSPETSETNVATQQPTALSHSPELLANVANDITWDKFLAQNSKILLERQLPEKALKLNKFIVANDVYVEALGELLRAAQKNKQTQLVDNYLAALDTRLHSLPIEQQAIYFAQAGSYLTMENGTNHLLAKAEDLFARLSKPELQLKAVLKLALVYSKAGNNDKANNYFNKINPLLTAITDLDTQAELRSAVALAYQEINNVPVALQWLSSIEPLLKQLKSETIGLLVANYAQCNQSKSVLTLVENAKDNHDAWLYHAMSVSLKAGFVASALELHKSLQAPIYQALADILIADYSPATASGLLDSAEKTINELPTFEKALALSQAIDYYGRVKNKPKVAALIAANKNILTSLPVSAEKDALLNAITLHYAHGLQTEQGSFLLTSIQSSPLKTRLNVELNHLADVGGILK